MSRDLILKLGEDAWNYYSERQTDPVFAKFEKTVLERDAYRCVFCDFSASSGMMVINLDHDYTNNKLSNLATACPFCQQCLFLEAAGHFQPGGGTIVYLPEISQAQLNALSHVLYASIVNGSMHAKSSDSYIQSIKLRASIVEKKFGKNMSSPSFLGQMLIDTPAPDIEQRRISILRDLRLLPSLEKYQSLVITWAKSAISTS